jgi:hypothetical protein
LLEKEPISKLCDEVELQPTVSTAGRRNSSRTGRPPSSRNGQPTTPPSRSGSPSLEKKIQTKDEVLAEHVAHEALGEL